MGSSAGANVAAPAFKQRLRVAIVDNGRFDDTCLNRGCIPTKILIYVADTIIEVEDSSRRNLQPEMKDVDFKGLMERMRGETWHDVDQIAECHYR
ncbi:MAG: hypothetical protein R6V83_14095 [Candidatus Thorarchaeota archaeon]